ncbi:aminodeoxychorismate lyase [Bacillus solimangrovi]|uniref:4-amino-4-deoxychorismate lyase n=1 Tax=Bacillus solimangrovi TaxID=1305675 RepID=A0A1E5LF02_9BACI|nr:aminodeoxychorismate lyase [Bacillus solimangrovi]OEH92652.1 4-amino-4-deoxychorismate lyase [Bacillus solimangrovi]
MNIYLNGEIIPQSEAKISPFDHGYMYGLGLFETFRVYDGHPFLLDDHLNRLRAGLKVMNIQWDISRQEVMQIIDDLLRSNQLKNAYVRMNVSAGTGAIGLQTDPYTEPTVMFMMKQVPNNGYFPTKKALFLKTIRNTPESPERLKSHHYLNNIIAKREVGSNPNIEGIFLTDGGHIAEGIVSNIFWVKGDVIYTPHVQTGILNGITRMLVIKIANRLGYTVKTGFYEKVELLNADEAFITNSIQEIVSLASVEEHSENQNHQVVPKLMNEYGQYVHSLWSIDELT